MFSAKVIKDTIFATSRITTLELTYPRFIHAEIMTHRDRARNAGSSRAIPWPTMCEVISAHPVIPIKWGAEQKGMQTGDEIERTYEAELIWIRARNQALQAAQDLANLGVHKSLCNRLTEPFAWITVVMTATKWRNFFLQRCHNDAEIHMQKIAHLMLKTIKDSTPVVSTFHTPYVDSADDFSDISKLPVRVSNDPMEVQLQISTARCARVSYVQHGKKERSNRADLDLFSRLLVQGHWSPFEHPAVYSPGRHGAYKDWLSYRHHFRNECPEEGYPLS